MPNILGVIAVTLIGYSFIIMIVSGERDFRKAYTEAAFQHGIHVELGICCMWMD